METESKKRRSGVPTGNAGEYFVMGELLRRGYDAQLADRNTKGYDILVGRPTDRALRKVQVESVRTQPWYVNKSHFSGDSLDLVTVYVLLGPEKGTADVRFFIAKNRDVAAHAHWPDGWPSNGFMDIEAVQQFKDAWVTVLTSGIKNG